MLNVCSNSNVSVLNQNAYDLLKFFCACPQGKQLIDTVAFIAPLIIEMGAFPNPQIQANGDPKTYLISDMRIKIPNKFGESTLRALRGITIELFNGKNMEKNMNFTRLANSGDLSIDEYARSVESSEYESLLDRYKLQSICKEAWEVEDDPLLQFSSTRKDYPIQRYLLEVEASCHTDTIRKRWIEYFQKSYCKKHPKDTYSCQARKNNFCDYAQVQKMPLKEKEKFTNKRICKIFLKLSQDEKKLLSAYVKDRCEVPKDEL